MRDREHEREALEAVTARRRELDAAEDALRDAVDEARDRGAAWDRVGKALGVTKQTAWEKFGPYAR